MKILVLIFFPIAIVYAMDDEKIALEHKRIKERYQEIKKIRSYVQSVKEMKKCELPDELNCFTPDVNNNTFLHWAAIYQPAEVIIELCKTHDYKAVNNFGMTPFIMAVCAGNTEGIKGFIKVDKHLAEQPVAGYMLWDWLNIITADAIADQEPNARFKYILAMVRVNFNQKKQDFLGNDKKS